MIQVIPVNYLGIDANSGMPDKISLLTYITGFQINNNSYYKAHNFNINKKKLSKISSSDKKKIIFANEVINYKIKDLAIYNDEEYYHNKLRNLRHKPKKIILNLKKKDLDTIIDYGKHLLEENQRFKSTLPESDLIDILNSHNLKPYCLPDNQKFSRDATNHNHYLLDFIDYSHFLKRIRRDINKYLSKIKHKGSDYSIPKKFSLKVVTGKIDLFDCKIKEIGWNDEVFIYYGRDSFSISSDFSSEMRPKNDCKISDEEFVKKFSKYFVDFVF